MKLISMTDFVLGTESDLDKYNPIGLGYDIQKRYGNIIKYANFLKQPLTLGMFVPCDEDGNVLEEPESYGLPVDRHNQGCHITEEHDKYYEAKERVLFEYKPQFDIGVIRHHISQKRTVEYLANFGELILTKSAIKQIGI